ncbi:MAG TPA: YkgJ family cysteine cluster protein [Nitrososphaeraceae archaeon]|nr:YkgJ family cysteine cluster protein [Nitrososphaeraceae archaeon]
MNTVSRESYVKNALQELIKRWNVERPVYDLHLGKRDDVKDTTIQVNKVIFHIPFLERDSLYLLWKCLWPDCHNCCEHQASLPLTKEDIVHISSKLGHNRTSDFVKHDAVISTRDDNSMGSLITTITMISLKRKENEDETDIGIPCRCRFLSETGSCSLHPDKPGVCWLYPFSSWIQIDKGRPQVHASFQLTGDCPGFYTAKNLEPIKEELENYSKIIFDYNMSMNRTTREGLGASNWVDA